LVKKVLGGYKTLFFKLFIAGKNVADVLPSNRDAWEQGPDFRRDILIGAFCRNDSIIFVVFLLNKPGFFENFPNNGGGTGQAAVTGEIASVG